MMDAETKAGWTKGGFCQDSSAIEGYTEKERMEYYNNNAHTYDDIIRHCSYR